MARINYIKEGPNKPEYGLSPTHNEKIDYHRGQIADSQGKKGTRDRLSDKVSREGGRVSWNEQPPDEITLPYTRKDHDNIKTYEEKVASHMKRLEALGVKVPNELTYSYQIDEFLTGTADFRIIYNAQGHVEIEKLKKGEVAAKPYGFTDAIGVLRNLERYASNVEKSKISENKRHGRQSQLEDIVASVVALASTFAGLFFMSGNITGYAVAGSQAAEPTFSLVGLAIFVVGFMGVFLFFKRK